VDGQSGRAAIAGKICKPERDHVKLTGGKVENFPRMTVEDLVARQEICCFESPLALVA
jgi:hypothetical protein